MEVKRISVGIPEVDEMLLGGIPYGFFISVIGEPGTGKTIFAIHFIGSGIRENEKCIYVSTEESRDSIIKQASMFNMDFKSAIQAGRLVIIDVVSEDNWSLSDLSIDTLLSKIIEAKKFLGYGPARLVIDSLSAFWLDKPSMARRYSYKVKNTLYKWMFTTIAISQYAITTESAFGFGVEHVADGIIRFTKKVINGKLRRFMLIEKMRQTPHDLHLHEIDIIDGIGLVVVGPYTRERVKKVV